jgi:hypothetical protein
MKVLESSNLSKLFATRLKSSDPPANQEKNASRSAAALSSGVQNTLEAATALVAVSKHADSKSVADVESAVKEAANSRPQDVDNLVSSLANRIQSNPQEAHDAQTSNLDLNKVGELLR